MRIGGDLTVKSWIISTSVPKAEMGTPFVQETNRLWEALSVRLSSKSWIWKDAGEALAKTVEERNLKENIVFQW